MQQINSSSLYRDVIKRALKVTWHHPKLWIFGFFATFLGLGGIFQVVAGQAVKSGAIFGQAAYNARVISLSGALVSSNLGRINTLNLILLLGAVILCLALFAFAVWLAVASFGALISSAYAIDKKKKLNFWKNFTQGRAHFWRLLSVNLAGKFLIIFFLTAIGLLISLIIADSSILRSLLYFFVFLVLVAASLILSFLTIYASSFVVLKARGLRESIESAWELFRENWVVSFEAAAVIFALNILAQAIIFVALIVFSLPFLVMLLLLYTSAAASAPVVILALWIFTAVIFLILAGSFFSTFQIVAWTYIFDKISKGGVLSKLHRIFG